MIHRTTAQLEAALDEIRQAPKQQGVVELIVRRPAENEREVLDEGVLDLDEGLVGDSWRNSPKRKPEMQLNLMNARVIALLADVPEQKAMAGDQFYIDLDLSLENLPPGTRLSIGTGVIEVTAVPHRGCAKFRKRYGQDAERFVNSTIGKQLNLRGINAKIIQGGVVRTGDAVTRLDQ